MKLISKKVIMGCASRGDGDAPYLTRYTLIQTRWGGLYVHVFHRSDHDVHHDHPWGFTSLILWGGYHEEVSHATDTGLFKLRATHRYRQRPGMLLRRKPEHRHRVVLIDGKPAVTLVWRGPIVREWGFWERSGWVQWQEYFRRMGC